MINLTRHDPFSLARTDPISDSVARSFTLAQDVDESKDEVKYSHGVLELSLPKKATSAGKVLAIQ